ncbi:putative F-box protein [Arachis hypogaea]|nr:putative F-box protein [Arachis hypogaea]
MGKQLRSDTTSPTVDVPAAKRIRRSKTICSCSSPRPPFLSAHSTFSWNLNYKCGSVVAACNVCISELPIGFSSGSVAIVHVPYQYDEDIWTEIAKFLDGKSLIMLAATNQWFSRAIMDDGIWKFVCIRDLQVPPPQRVAFSWSQLYKSVFDGSHSYMFRQQEKHIGAMEKYCHRRRQELNVGDDNIIAKAVLDAYWRFSFDSSVAILAERLSFPGKIKERETLEKMLRSQGCCVVENVKPGIWIADLQLVRCPVCDLNTCDGTMQTLDARHIELFLCEGYKNGSWDYQLVGSHDIKKRADGAAGAIFDAKHLEDSSTSAVFDYKSWIGKPNDWQPKAMIAFHAVAVNTNLQENEGINVKYHAMRAGPDGEVVSIRISQQLL